MTAQIKLNTASGGGSVSLKAPSTTTSNAAVEFKLPIADGSAGQVLMTDGSGNLSWVSLPSAGLAMAQQWQTTSHQTLNSSYVTLNTWQAVSLTGAGSLGTGLTHNSGTFSFPSTGIYHLSAIGTFNDSTNNQDFMNLGFNITTNNSSYTRVVNITGGITQNPNYEAIAAEYILDVTDISNVKFQVTAQDQHGAGRVFGESTTIMSSLTVMRLGDT
jgi:hypothetical protein